MKSMYKWGADARLSRPQVAAKECGGEHGKTAQGFLHGFTRASDRLVLCRAPDADSDATDAAVYSDPGSGSGRVLVVVRNIRLQVIPSLRVADPHFELRLELAWIVQTRSRHSDPA